MIGGVQGSLNQIFNLVKFLLVIAMPDPNMFGFLILASFAFVSLGAVSMTGYAFLSGQLNCRGGRRKSRKQIYQETKNCVTVL